MSPTPRDGVPSLERGAQIGFAAIGDPVTADLTLFDDGRSESYVASMKRSTRESRAAMRELRGVPLERIGEFPISAPACLVDSADVAHLWQSDGRRFCLRNAQPPVARRGNDL